jgi:hypothetical protein
VALRRWLTKVTAFQQRTADSGGNGGTAPLEFAVF